MRYLLDTNVLSEMCRRRPNAGVKSWLTQNEMACGISELVIGELTKGAFRLPTAARRNATLGWIEEVENQFEGRLVPLDLPTLKCWGELCGGSEKKGRRLPVIDSLMAATAIVNDLILVTRNVDDTPPDVRVLNPWT